MEIGDILSSVSSEALSAVKYLYNLFREARAFKNSKEGLKKIRNNNKKIKEKLESLGEKFEKARDKLQANIDKQNTPEKTSGKTKEDLKKNIKQKKKIQKSKKEYAASVKKLKGEVKKIEGKLEKVSDSLDSLKERLDDLSNRKVGVSATKYQRVARSIEKTIKSFKDLQERYSKLNTIYDSKKIENAGVSKEVFKNTEGINSQINSDRALLEEKLAALKERVEKPRMEEVGEKNSISLEERNIINILRAAKNTSQMLAENMKYLVSNAVEAKSIGEEIRNEIDKSASPKKASPDLGKQ